MGLLALRLSPLFFLSSQIFWHPIYTFLLSLQTKLSSLLFHSGSFCTIWWIVLIHPDLNPNYYYGSSKRPSPLPLEGSESSILITYRDSMGFQVFLIWWHSIIERVPEKVRRVFGSKEQTQYNHFPVWWNTLFLRSSQWGFPPAMPSVWTKEAIDGLGILYQRVLSAL